MENCPVKVEDMVTVIDVWTGDPVEMKVIYILEEDTVIVMSKEGIPARAYYDEDDEGWLLGAS